jgi:hypothetical protein
LKCNIGKSIDRLQRIECLSEIRKGVHRFEHELGSRLSERVFFYLGKIAVIIICIFSFCAA